MKIALIGTGKTGGKVLELAEHVTAFNSTNLPTLDALKGHDVIISFLTGTIFEKYISLFIDTSIPLVTGTTGIKWPENINEQLLEINTPWIWGTNFSLGMVIVKNMIGELAKANKLFDTFDFQIHEVHHTQKLDAPSGTALSWNEWIDNKASISSSREEDVVGIHNLVLNTPQENITLRHEAKDRALFAQGALWAANLLYEKNITPGFHLFQDIARQYLNRIN